MNTFIGFIRSFTAHTVVQSSIVVMGGSMVSNVLAYLYHLIVGRILGPSLYGELAALLSLFYILNVPSSVVQTILTKFFSVLRARNSSGEVKSLFISSLKGIAVLSFIGFGVVALGAQVVASFLHIESKSSLYWLYGTFSLYFIGMVPLSVLAAYQKFVAQQVITLVGMAARLLLAVFAAPYGVAWTLASNVFANIISLVASVAPLRFLLEVESRPVTLLKSRAMSYSVPTLITTLAIAALYNQDVLLVKHFFSPIDAGIYSSLSVLGKVIYYASSAITFVLFPVISERNELQRGHTRLVSVSLLFVAGLSGVLTALYFLFPRFVVHLLYGESYEAAVPYVGMFGVFISFFTLDNMLFSICLAAEKTKVWVLGLGAAIAQFGIIWLYHPSIPSIITANTVVASGLFVALLLYYTHEKQSD